MSMFFDPSEWMSCVDNNTIPTLINVNTGVQWSLILDTSTAKPVKINMSVPYAVPITMLAQAGSQV